MKGRPTISQHSTLLDGWAIGVVSDCAVLLIGVLWRVLWISDLAYLGVACLPVACRPTDASFPALVACASSLLCKLDLAE